MKIRKNIAALAVMGAVSISSASAADLEVSHWWTSGGEAAAVAELEKAFNKTGNTWVDGAIAGSSFTAIPIIVSRIIGGSPMGAAQIPRGRQADELVEAGLIRDLTELAEKENWAASVLPSVLDACTYDGKIYCVPVEIHSWQWMWLSNKAFKDAGQPIPKNWNEFVSAAPELEKAGVVPLAMGGQTWQHLLAFNVILASVGGQELYMDVYDKKNMAEVEGAKMVEVFSALDDARRLAKNSRVQDWNEATNLVITGKAGGQIMGDWAQAEFQVAGLTAGSDYTCLPGLGANDVVSTGGDAFYFPVLDDEEASVAQLDLASVLLNSEVQVAFNLKKGSLPVRHDLNLDQANECMKKGLDILASGDVVVSTDELLSPDASSQIQDLMSQFFANEDISPADAQKQFATIIGSAD